jgi:hypothetical protein
MNTDTKFDDIRPYLDAEAPEVLERLIKDPRFIYMLKKVKSEEEIKAEFSQLKDVHTIEQFQKKHIAPYARNIIDLTIDELTYDGLEHIDPEKSYLFLGNHRDIILDSALLNSIFSENDIPISEIGLGDNLLIFDWIKDLVKLNRGFIVKRSLKGRQMLEASMILSEYIYRNIAENRRSVWLAQRPGRTKDGHDITHPGLVKMLMLNDRKNPETVLNTLNICPVCISYQNEPCEESKILASYHTVQNIPYEKTAEEDLKSMGRGLLYKKGRVHIHVSPPVDFTGKLSGKNLGDNEITAEAAKIIDKQIYKGYKLFPKNYAAYDALNNTDKYLKAKKYDSEHRLNIEREVERIADELGKEKQVIKHIYTKMYASPTANWERIVALK